MSYGVAAPRLELDQLLSRHPGEGLAYRGWAHPKARGDLLNVDVAGGKFATKKCGSQSIVGAKSGRRPMRHRTLPSMASQCLSTKQGLPGVVGNIPATN